MRISRLQHDILRTIAVIGRQGLRVGQIATAVQRPHSSISRSLKHLEGGGYIVREDGIVKITVPGMSIVREDLRPVTETLASIASSYRGLRSLGQQYQMSFSLVRDLVEQYRRNFSMISESARQYQSQIQHTLRLVAETGQAIQKTYGPVVGDMARMASAISQNLPGVVQAMQVAARQFDEMFRTLQPVFSELAKLPAASRAVQEKLLSRGWLISPMLPIGDFLWIYRELETHEIELAESNLIERFDGRCEELIAQTYEHEPFRRRRYLLDQALNAHRRGEYGLAIPVFLSAVEGVVVDTFGDRKLFTSRNRWIRRAPVDKLTEVFFEAFWTTMVDRLWKSYGLKDEAPAGELNRHMVLHGRSVDYSTKRNSIQAILALSYLGFIVGEYVRRTSMRRKH